MSSKEIIVDLSGRKTKVSQKKDDVQSGQTESTEIYELTKDVEISTEEYPRFAQSFQLTQIEFTKLGNELAGFDQQVEERDKTV
jgi:hypothetical protein